MRDALQYTPGVGFSPIPADPAAIVADALACAERHAARIAARYADVTAAATDYDDLPDGEPGGDDPTTGPYSEPDERLHAAAARANRLTALCQALGNDRLWPDEDAVAARVEATVRDRWLAILRGRKAVVR